MNDGRDAHPSLPRHLLEASVDVVIVVDDAGSVTAVSRSARDRFGWTDSELALAAWRDVVHPDDAPRVEALLAETQLLPALTPVDVRIRRADGSWDTMSLFAYTPIADADFAGSVLVLRDATISMLARRFRNLDREIERMRTHDPVTGLVWIGTLLRTARLRAPMNELLGHDSSVVVFTIGDDERLEDSMAPDAVDELARTIAATIERELEPDDLLGRGEFGEFIAVLQHRDTASAGSGLARRVLLATGQGVWVGRTRIAAGISIGECDVGSDGDVAIAVRRAKVAAGWARTDGSGFERYSPARHLAEERTRTIRRELADAIRHAQLDVHFQPIIDTRTGRVAGLEGLLRADRNTGLSAALPALFDAIADGPMQIELDRYVIGVGCRRAQMIATALGDECPRISLNVSPRSLADPGFIDLVEDTLRVTLLDPGRLCLEITERTELPADNVVDAHVIRLRALGVAIAVDDFGAGYSSLNRLQQIDADMVKIDRSLVCRVTFEPRAAGLVESAVAMGRAMNAVVVAEGVELIEEQDFLESIGCSLIQGYLVSGALPWLEAVDFVRVAAAGVPQTDAASRVGSDLWHDRDQ